MSATQSPAKRLIRGAARPFKAVVKALLRSVIRRTSARFAADIVPLEELAKKVEELSNRQDLQEGFQWDHAALAKRLAVIEDHLEKLLQHQQGAEEHSPTEEPAGVPQVIRLSPSEANRAEPRIHERQYRWEKTG